jgi:SOS-response transcriptional repressor LexA
MSNKNLAGHALQIIYRYWLLHNRTYPTSREIADALSDALKQSVSVNHWGGIKAQLIRKKLLQPSEIWGIELTETALKKLQSNFDGKLIELTRSESSLSNVLKNKAKGTGITLKSNPLSEGYFDISLFGVVKAGLGSRLDDLAVYSGDETISIPHITSDPSKVFALRVDGESMVHEDIFPGDYIVIEKASLIELQEGDLVVVRYLPESFNKKTREQIDIARQDIHNFEGPTLKYYSKQKRGSGEAMHRLSWKTDPQNSPFAIYTRYIEPDETGKVIAIYTPERYRKIK